METRQTASSLQDDDSKAETFDEIVRSRRSLHRMACPSCTLRFNKYHLLHSHMLHSHNIHLDDSYSCYICHLICKNARGLWLHLAISHWGMQRRKIGKKRRRAEPEEAGGRDADATEDGQSGETKGEPEGDLESLYKTELPSDPEEKLEDPTGEQVCEQPPGLSAEKEEETFGDESEGGNWTCENAEVKVETNDHSDCSAINCTSSQDLDFIVFPCSVCNQRLPRATASEHLRGHHTEVCSAYYSIDNFPAKLAITRMVWELMTAEKAWRGDSSA